MPQHVPGCTQIGKRLALGVCFLHAVLAKITHARCIGFANQFRRVRLGNSHQLNVLAPPSVAKAGCRDSFFYPRNVVLDVRDHLSWQTRAWRSPRKILDLANRNRAILSFPAARAGPCCGNRRMLGCTIGPLSAGNGPLRSAGASTAFSISSHTNAIMVLIEN